MGHIAVVVLFVLAAVMPRLALADRRPAELVGDGDAHEQARRWDEAQATWEALARVQDREGYALYRQGRLALELGDPARAATLAARALRAPGVPAVEARLLYGDALFHAGEHARAKAVYVAVARTLAPPAKQQVARRITSANRALHLPDADGLDGPSPGPEPALASGARVAPADTTPRRRPPSPPPGDRDPRALLRVGAAHEAAGSWADAAGVYARLARLPGYAGRGLYLQARATLAGGDARGALSLAARSIQIAGAHRNEAKLIYGAALYRQGEYRRAKLVYLAVLRASTGPTRRTAMQQVIACNRALRLPEQDGVAGAPGATPAAPGRADPFERGRSSGP